MTVWLLPPAQLGNRSISSAFATSISREAYTLYHVSRISWLPFAALVLIYGLLNARLAFFSRQATQRRRANRRLLTFPVPHG